jgi:hypothetical protein
VSCEQALDEDNSPEATAELAYCLGKLGDVQQARELANGLSQRAAAGQHIPAAAMAVAELGLGSKRYPSAIDILQDAVASKDEWPYGWRSIRFFGIWPTSRGFRRFARRLAYGRRPSRHASGDRAVCPSAD